MRQETWLILFPPPWVWRFHSSEPKGCKYYNAGKQWLNDDGMMALLNANIFRVTGPLCREFTGDRWIPLTKASNAEILCFLWSAPWIDSWVNNCEAGVLRHHRAHYDIIVMLWLTACMVGLFATRNVFSVYLKYLWINDTDHIVSYVLIGSFMNFTLDILSHHELRVIMITTLSSLVIPECHFDSFQLMP